MLSPLVFRLVAGIAAGPGQAGPVASPPPIFRLVAGLIAVLALAQAAFPRAMTSWRMRRAGGDGTIEPSRGRLVMMRVMGLVVAAIAGLMALGGGSLLF